MRLVTVTWFSEIVMAHICSDHPISTSGAITRSFLSVPPCLRGRLVFDFPITAMSAITGGLGDSPSSSRTPWYRTPGLPSTPPRSAPASASHRERPSASIPYSPAHHQHLLPDGTSKEMPQHRRQN